jgi:hypothetical protein
MKVGEKKNSIYAPNVHSEYFGTKVRFVKHFLTQLDNKARFGDIISAQKKTRNKLENNTNKKHETNNGRHA